MDEPEPLPIFPEEHYQLARALVVASAEEHPPCQQYPEMWWPKVGNVGDQLQARNLCNTRCTMTALCLQFAIETGEAEGVWGGTTPGQRQDLIRLHRKDQSPNATPSDGPTDADLRPGRSEPGVQEASA